MVKLRNSHDPKIDDLLTSANAYMLLTADSKQPIPGLGPAGATRGNFNSVIDEYKARADGADGTVKPSRLRPFFTRSTLAFMSAGASVTVYSDKSNFAGPGMVYFRSVEPYGQIVLTNEKSGDVDGMDAKGNPKDPLATIPMDWITECRTGVTVGQFSSDKKKVAKPECCFTLMYRVDGKEDAIITSIDLETRDAGTRDAWATGIQEYISSVLEGNEGADDDDLFSFIKGGPKRGGGGIAGKSGGKKLTESVAAEDEKAVAESLEKKFAAEDITKLGKALLADDDDDDVSGIDLFGKDPVRKSKAKHDTGVAVTGDGAPPPPPGQSPRDFCCVAQLSWRIIHADVYRCCVSAHLGPPPGVVMAPDMVMGSGAPPPPPGECTRQIVLRFS